MRNVILALLSVAYDTIKETMADSLDLIPFEAAITALVHLISQGDYEAIAANGQAGRMGAEGIKCAVETYPYTVIPLPSEAFELAEVYRIDETRLDIYLPLWTPEEGRSDLTLCLSCYTIGSNTQVEVNDLRVL